MTLTDSRPYADPEAARKLIDLANSVEAVRDGRIHIELLNGPMLFDLKPRRPNIPRSQVGDRTRLAGETRVRDLREFTQAGAKLLA